MGIINAYFLISQMMSLINYFIVRLILYIYAYFLISQMMGLINYFIVRLILYIYIYIYIHQELSDQLPRSRLQQHHLAFSYDAKTN